MFISQYLELSLNPQKHPWIGLFIAKSWALGIKASFSCTKGCPLGNLGYLILPSRFPSMVLFLLLDKLPGSVYNQSMSTVPSYLKLCVSSQEAERVFMFTYLPRLG